MAVEGNQGYNWKKLFIYKGTILKHDSETRRKVVMLNLFLFIGFSLLVIMGTVALAQNAYGLSIADFTLGGVFFGLLAYLHRTGDEPTCSLFGVVVIMLFFIYIFVVGGVRNTTHMWLYSFPLFSLFLLGFRKGGAVVILLLLVCLSFLILDQVSESINVYTRDFAIRFIPSYIVVCVLAFLVEHSRAQTRKELEDARNQLEIRVKKRTAELESVNVQLRHEIEQSALAEKERSRLEAALNRAEKMESLGRLAGGVAHDLNNVLSGVVSYPDLLLSNLPLNDPLREPLENIRDAGQRAAAIVDDLLSLARSGITVRRPLCLNNLITDHLKSLEHISLKSNYPRIPVFCDLAPDLKIMSGSTIHLKKMLMNLLINSFEAIENTGDISISTKNETISDSVDSEKNSIVPGEYLVLKISDNGIGISKKNINKIFEPFFSSKTVGRSGTGLGMTVIWGTVTDHDGNCEIDSKEGEGTTITIHFPVSVLPEELSDSMVVPIIEKGNHETILVVDDDPVQLKLCREILTTLGYETTTVSSGEEALIYLESHPVDLVLLDMIMTLGIDGLDTYREIIKIAPDQKVIVVSGYCETERMQQALSLGINGVLKKPYTLEEIMEAINKQLI
jgi:signal transduction histidine kinase